MNMKQTEKQEKPKRRRILKICIIILAVFLVLALVIDLILNWTVKEKIESQLKDYDKVKAVHIDDISYSMFGNCLSFNNVDITLINNSKFSDKQVDIKANEIELDGMNWLSFFFGDEISLDELLIEQPFIVMYDSSSSYEKVDSTEENNTSLFTLNELYDALPERVRPLSIDQFEINEGELTRKTMRDSNIVIDTLKNISLTVNEIEITQEKVDKNLIAAESFDLHLDNWVSKFETVGNILMLKEIKLSSSDSLISIKEISYKPFLSTDEYFARRQYRSDIFNIEVNDVRLELVNFNSFVKEKFIQIGKVSAAGFYLDVITNKQLPRDPNDTSPKMPSEVLHSIGYKIGIDKISLSNGQIYKKSIHPYFEEYSNIYFTGIDCEINSLSNFGEKLCILDANAKLQNSAPLHVYMSIDLTDQQNNFSYYGSLGTMDAKELNTHLVVEDKTKIHSGSIEKIIYDVNVEDGVASVSIKPLYKDLSITILGEKDKRKKTLPTFIANSIKLRKSNPADNKEPVTGNVKYTPKHDDTFLDIVWQPLLKGLGDVVGF